MKKLVLHIGSKALSDWKKYGYTIAKSGFKDEADRYYSLLIDEFDFLKTNYNIGNSAEYICPGYRVSFVKSHIIFYKIVDDQKLEIIRIIHQIVNINKALK